MTSARPAGSSVRMLLRSFVPLAIVVLVALVGATNALGREGLGDMVFHDVNNDGVMNASEVGAPGVVVTAEVDRVINATGLAGTDCLGDGDLNYPRRSVVTNAYGAYFFEAVGQGNLVVELAPENFASGGPLAGFTSSTGSVLASGPYEPGIAESNSVGDDGKDHGTMVDGRIRACNIDLRQGGEPVGESPTPGIVIVDPDASQQTTIDFGVFKPTGVPTAGGGVSIWSVGDLVWNDLDRDGRQDRGEPGLVGVQVRLYDPTGAVVGTTTTDRRGRYRLIGLVVGTFRIGFAGLPLLAKPTLPTVGAARERDSNVLPRTRRTPPIVMRHGMVDRNVDAGFLVPTGVGGFVWRDSDRDGQQDIEETGIAGVAVALENAAGKAISRTRTNRTGRFFFSRIRPGRYRVVMSKPPKGLQFTTPRRGSSLIDSDILGSAGRTAIIRVGRGRQVLTIGVGLRAPAPRTPGA